MDNTPDESQIERVLLLKAEQYCAQSEHCRSEVKEKLHQWGCTASMADDIVRQLIDDEYIDEERYSHQYCDTKLRLHAWGRRKIAAQLRTKQIDSHIIAQALNDIDSEQYHSVLLSAAEKKLRSLHDSDATKRDTKLMAYLASHGFEIEEIKEVINHINNTL